MSYLINNYKGESLVVLEDGTVDTSTSIGLVGRNYVGYGEIQNENFVYLLENFANTAPPARAMPGQLWFDTTNKTVNAYDGDLWNNVGAAILSDNEPETTAPGSFWLKTPVNILYTWTGSAWRQIGPEAVEGFADTKAKSVSLTADNGFSYPVVQIVADGVVQGIWSAYAFRIDATDAITGFDEVNIGLTMSRNSKLHGDLVGKADSADRLQTTRSINGVGFNGTEDISIEAPTPNRLTAGDYLIGSSFTGSADTTWNVKASTANQIGTVVARDASGDFSAGTITADLIGNVTGNVTASQGTSTFNTVIANEFIGETLSGNAFSATKLQTGRRINGVTFDATADIIVPASARTLTDNALAPNVLSSNLEQLGTLRYLILEDAGINVGVNDELKIYNENGSPVIDSSKDTLSFSVTTLQDDKETISLLSSRITGDRATLQPIGNIDLGTADSKYRKMYADQFVGNLVGNADTSTSAVTATNIRGGGNGAIPYQISNSVTNFVAPVANRILRSGSDGVPFWGASTFTELQAGDYINGLNYDGVVNTTWSVDATTTNTANKIVARDSSGNFSAGTITASLNGVSSQASTVYVDESEDNNSEYNIAFLDSTGGGNGYKTLQVDNTAFTFNPSSNTLTVANINGTATGNVRKNGDTMTGYLTLHANPTSNLHAATKQYVDSAVDDALTQGQLRAYVRFDGSDLRIKNSLRVSSVQRLSTGRYRINFQSGTFTNANYIITGIASDTDHFVAFRSSTTSYAEINTVDNGSGNDSPSTTSGDVMVTFFT